MNYYFEDGLTAFCFLAQCLAREGQGEEQEAPAQSVACPPSSEPELLTLSNE